MGGQNTRCTDHLFLQRFIANLTLFKVKEIPLLKGQLLKSVVAAIVRFNSLVAHPTIQNPGDLGHPIHQVVDYWLRFFAPYQPKRLKLPLQLIETRYKLLDLTLS